MNYKFRYFSILILLSCVPISEATVIDETRSIPSISVSIASSDSAIRVASYYSALVGAFPEVADSLTFHTELRDEQFGNLASFFQVFRGLRVHRSQMWLRVLPNGKANLAGGKYHQGIGLPDLSLLRDKDNQQILIDFVKPLCPDWDSVAAVEAVVLPVQGVVSGEMTYHYALVASPLQVLPPRVFDWQTGELLEQWEPRYLNGYVDITYRPSTNPNVPAVTEPCANCAYLRAWNIVPQQTGSAQTNANGNYSIVVDDDWWRLDWTAPRSLDTGTKFRRS